MSLKKQRYPRRRVEQDLDLWLPETVSLLPPNLTIEWDFFTQERPRTFDGYTGVGKYFLVNSQTVFSSELHPLSEVPTVYGPDNKQLVRVEEEAVPLRRWWVPDYFTFVEEGFHAFHRPKKWKWGNSTEKYRYDDTKRLTSVQACSAELTYGYASQNVVPSQVAYPSGHVYTIGHSRQGDLEFVRTPAGFTHSFGIIPFLGKSVTLYYPPWSETPFAVTHQAQGETTKITMPSGSTISITNRSRKATLFFSTQNKTLRIFRKFANVFDIFTTFFFYNHGL